MDSHTKSRVFDALRGSPQYAFVRLSTPMHADGSAPDLAEFAALIARPIRSSVEDMGRLRERRNGEEARHGYTITARDSLSKER